MRKIAFVFLFLVLLGISFFGLIIKERLDVPDTVSQQRTSLEETYCLSQQGIVSITEEGGFCIYENTSYPIETFPFEFKENEKYPE